MVKWRSQQPPVSARKRDRGFSKDELQIVPQLWAMLRSGALTSLMEGVSSEPTASVAPRQQSIVSGGQAPHVRQPKNVLPATEWKEIKTKKQPNRAFTEPSEMLDSEGWSASVRAKVSDLRMGTPGVCLASTSETKQIQ